MSVITPEPCAPPVEYIPLAYMGVPDGVATLGSDGLLSPAQLPPLALSEFKGLVASQAAMTALTAEPGDYCIRTDFDPDRWFVLTAEPASVAANWIEITAAGGSSQTPWTSDINAASFALTSLGRLVASNPSNSSGIVGSFTAAPSSGTLTTGVGVDIVSSGAAAITTMVGLRITGLAVGGTRWGLQIGNYNNYIEGSVRIGAVSAGSIAPAGAFLEVISSVPTLVDTARFVGVATNDDVIERIYQARAATTDGTITTAQTITCAVDTTTFVFATIVARRTGGAAGAAQDGAAYTRAATFKNTAGTVAQIGATVATVTNESQAAWDCVFDVTGATARVRVTGATDNNVTWHVTSHIFQVSS